MLVVASNILTQPLNNCTEEPDPFFGWTSSRSIRISSSFTYLALSRSRYVAVYDRAVGTRYDPSMGIFQRDDSLKADWRKFELPASRHPITLENERHRHLINSFHTTNEDESAGALREASPNPAPSSHVTPAQRGGLKNVRGGSADRWRDSTVNRMTDQKDIKIDRAPPNPRNRLTTIASSALRRTFLSTPTWTE